MNWMINVSDNSPGQVPEDSQIRRLPHGDWVLGNNPSIRRIARHAERASEVQCTVLLSGETGTGKEVWAKLLHHCGPRQEKPFVPVNCAALTATLAAIIHTR